MANLKTHEGRMAAVEAAYEAASSAVEKVQIVQTAAQLDRDNSYLQRDIANSSHLLGTAQGSQVQH